MSTFASLPQMISMTNALADVPNLQALAEETVDTLNTAVAKLGKEIGLTPKVIYGHELSDLGLNPADLFEGGSPDVTDPDGDIHESDVFSRLNELVKTSRKGFSSEVTGAWVDVEVKMEELGRLIAEALEVEFGGVEFGHVEFGGTLAKFAPTHEGQEQPDLLREADPSGDWE